MTVKRMIETNRVPIRCPDPMNGWTTLFYAIRFRLDDIVHFVLDHGHEAYGVSRDVDGNTALMISILFDNQYVRNIPLSEPYNSFIRIGF